jgi:hypothetical protein
VEPGRRIGQIPKSDLEPLYLGAKEENRLARGPDLRALVEDQSLPPLAKSHELLLVHRVILTARRDDFHRLWKNRWVEFIAGPAADDQWSTRSLS